MSYAATLDGALRIPPKPFRLSVVRPFRLPSWVRQTSITGSIALACSWGMAELALWLGGF